MATIVSVSAISRHYNQNNAKWPQIRIHRLFQAFSRTDACVGHGTHSLDSVIPGRFDSERQSGDAASLSPFSNAPSAPTDIPVTMSGRQNTIGGVSERRDRRGGMSARASRWC